MEIRALVLGRANHKDIYGKRHYTTWLKLPDLWPNRILTFYREDEFLPHGFRTAAEILVSVDPDSLRYDGNYYVADLEVLDVISRAPSPDSGKPEEDS